MTNINGKRNFIYSLNFAFNAANKISETGSGEDTYLTYFTPGYIITGKNADIEGFDAESLDSFHEELTQGLISGKVSIISVAFAFNKLSKKEFLKSEENGAYDEDKVIVLEDVIIKSQDGENYHTPLFILFVDQIIGVIPATLSEK